MNFIKLEKKYLCQTLLLKISATNKEKESHNKIFTFLNTEKSYIKTLDY